MIEGKNRENDQLRTRLKHNAKGFEALALTVDHLGKKVSSYMNLFFGVGGWGGGANPSMPTPTGDWVFKNR